VGEARVDLDGHPPVDAVARLELRGEDVARGAHVVRGHRADGGLDVSTALGELPDLCVVGVPFAKGGLEDRRVCGDTDDALARDEFGEVAGLDAVTGEVVEPHRDARVGELLEVGVLSHAVLSLHLCE